jgi:hypothetical protein
MKCGSLDKLEMTRRDSVERIRKSSSVLLRHSPNFVFQRRRVNVIPPLLVEENLTEIFCNVNWK